MSGNYCPTCDPVLNGSAEVMNDAKRYWAMELRPFEPTHEAVYVREPVVFASEYDRLRREVAEARTIAFQDVLNSIQDRQVKDHVARCLQDKFGVWWKTAEEK